MKIIPLLIFVFFCKLSVASAGGLTLSESNIRDYSMKYCLKTNYITAGMFYGKYFLADISYADTAAQMKKESPKKLTMLHNFIEKETGNYYKENIFMAEKSRHVSNTIFRLCLQFYKSEQLADYINKFILGD